MTQDEVNLIYDYLHENYEYVDGELIAKHDLGRKNKKKGDVLGGCNFPISARSSISAEIKLNGRRICLKLAHFIFIYHFKKKAVSILYLDNNPMNHAIENLKELNARHSRSGRLSINNNKGYYQRPQNKEGDVTVVARKNKTIYHIGLYDCKIIAQDAYNFASKLIMETELPKDCIISLVREKYPTIKMKKKENQLIEKEKKLKTISKSMGTSKRGNKYRSQIKINGRKKSLGTYGTVEEAHEAYIKAKKEFNKP